MRLGEFRTFTRDMDNKLIINLACYDTVKGVRIYNLEWDMSNDNELFLRVVGDENKKVDIDAIIRDNKTIIRDNERLLDLAERGLHEKEEYQYQVEKILKKYYKWYSKKKQKYLDNVVIYKAHDLFAYEMKQIAKELGIEYSRWDEF